MIDGFLLLLLCCYFPSCGKELHFRFVATRCVHAEGETPTIMASTPTKSSKFARVCVYCGSSSGNKPAFLEAAASLGDELVRRGIGLVYGGGSVGLMGQVSGTVFNKGGKVLGVIPVALEPVELSGESIGEVGLCRS